MPRITEIEQAIVSRLSGALPYLRACCSLAEFLGRDAREVEELAILCPAVYVIYRQGKFSRKLSGAQDREMTFGVVVVVRNLRGDAAVRHGAPGEKGVYEVLEDVRAALSDQSCGVEIDPFAPVSEHSIAGTRNFAVYEILFKTRCRFIL